MPNFTRGVLSFQRDIFPGKQKLFERLSEGQSPEALFITCSDSRIDTAMMTQTEPGEIFVCRNAGNIVPPHSPETEGMTASIEFAVTALRVPHIVVCGHSGCGAMKGAMNVDALDTLPHIKQWLGFAKAAVHVVNELGAGRSDEEKLQMLLEQNVVLQLDHLKTHPSVAARLAAGDLELHGWVYDIGTGAVNVLDEKSGIFSPIEGHYVEDVAKSVTGA